MYQNDPKGSANYKVRKDSRGRGLTIEQESPLRAHDFIVMLNF